MLGDVIPGIEAKRIPGLRRFDVLRLDLGDEVEFATIMTFDSIENVIALQGEDYEWCYVPDVARAVLKRWDPTCAHYDAVEAKTHA